MTIVGLTTVIALVSYLVDKVSDRLHGDTVEDYYNNLGK